MILSMEQRYANDRPDREEEPSCGGVPGVKMRFLCPICGQELREAHAWLACSFCGILEEGEWGCPNGHSQCEGCRLAEPAEIIERVCAQSQESDPVQIADLLMSHPSFHAYGPEHHLLVAPVLLAALRNIGRPINAEKIEMALRRLADIPVAVCASRGDCGAAVGVGCALSLVTGATIHSGRERSLALRGTAHALERLADLGGSRCCKQSVYASIEEGCRLFREELGLELPSHTIQCRFAAKSPECRKDRCVYYF